MAPEHPGHRGQHARPVEHLHVDVVLRFQIVDGADNRLAQGADRCPRSPAPVAGRVDEVAQHRAGSGPPTGAPAIQHQLSHRVALHEHCVEGVPHRGQWMIDRHHRRVHPHGQLGLAVHVAHPLGDSQQLDHVPQPPGVGDVGGADAGDALPVHASGQHPGAECHRGDDGCLGCGIKSLHIGGGIALGKPQRLRVGQGVVIAGAVLCHLAQDVVGGSVDDAHHPADRLGGQGLPQGTDEGDSSADRGLEQKVHSGGVGRGIQLCAIVGQQLFVAGDHWLAQLQRGRHQLAGRLDSPDQLHHHIHFGIVHH